MQELRIASLGFQRVAEGMAEVENAPAVLFLLVARNHFSLDAHRIADHAVHNVGCVRKDALRLAVHQPEQIRVGDHAVLDDFEQARAVFALGQRVEHAGSMITAKG